MKKKFLVLCIACALMASGCATEKKEDAPRVTETGIISESPAPTESTNVIIFEPHILDDIIISAPANWTMTQEVTSGGHRTVFHDDAIPAAQWGEIDVLTNLSIYVANEDWALQNMTAQEYADIRFDQLNADGKEKTVLDISGIEAGMISHDRPYLGYKLAEVFVPYNGQEYFISMHYDGGDAEIAEIAATIIDSIKIAE